MYGKVTKCFPDKGYAFILGEDYNSYFLHYSNLNGEYIEKGYYVYFVPFQNDRSDFNASKVTVINAPDSDICQKFTRRTKYTKQRKEQ